MSLTVRSLLYQNKWLFGRKALYNGNMSMIKNVKPGLILMSKSYSNEKDDKNVSSDSTQAPSVRYAPTKWEKRFLVWTKRYPSIDQVPSTVPRETLDKARNKARIYINLGMIGLTIFASIAMIISGKRAAKRGESVQKQNLDWHESHKKN